ncbi:hypothetical protein BH09PSE4_BH09PSE4_17780 [soil metagenome]
MAYMEFTSAGAGANAPRAASHDPVPTFSALEWLVVALAERDGLASIGRASRFAALAAKLFERAKPGLANSRLEALRRFAVLAWHHDDIAAADLAAFQAEGFTIRQRDALLASIAPRRNLPRSFK